MDDLISRQAAIDAVGDVHPLDYNGQAILHRIQQLPSAEKHGKWIWDDEGYHCSECFYHAYGETGAILSNEWHFCPNCGTRMDYDEEG